MFLSVPGQQFEIRKKSRLQRRMSLFQLKLTKIPKFILGYYFEEVSVPVSILGVLRVVYSQPMKFRRFIQNNQFVSVTSFARKMRIFEYFLCILYTATLFGLTRCFPTVNTPGNVCPPEDISCSCQNEHVAKTTVRYCEKNVGKCVPCEDLRTICHRKCHNGKL